MVKGGGCSSFAAEAFEGLRVFGKVVGEEFESNEAAELKIFGFVDISHTSAANFLQDAVMGDRLPDERVGS
jgi:hypothetical protein